MTSPQPKRLNHADGGYEYRLNGELHREGGPAVESGKGDQWWFKHNLLHREGGPAVTHANGSRWWYQKGQLHREDGPAYEGADGTTAWYLNGKPFDPTKNKPVPPQVSTKRKPPSIRP
jgi:hypothetical protein